MHSLINIENYEIPIGNHLDKKVVLSWDHRGVAYVRDIIKYLESFSIKHNEVGNFSKERCDYPEKSFTLGKIISNDYPNSVGIGLCGSGIGIMQMAGKHKRVFGARCAYSEEARKSRIHNNTNLLTIGMDNVSLDSAINIIHSWMITPFYSDPENESRYMDRYIQSLKLEDELWAVK
ncbi:MAG: RpiB/LacA/LacB family sugar-phosphate isomerase [Candidatus Pacearchaeota archaeon]|jgi:ribose 5-phosphate isomerase B